jgi:NAD(P)-dependent dehydrogenase (short-subunit alcohol dehydrogenase family)
MGAFPDAGDASKVTVRGGDAMRLKNEVAIVTGAAHGIGRAIAERFVREGAAVGMLDVDIDGVRAAAAALGQDGARTVALAADVAHSGQLDEVLKVIARDLGTPTILVNNAGIPGFVPLMASEAEALWHRVLAVNLTGAYLCTRHTMPYMREAGYGSIINIASTRALMSEPNGEPYGASKGGLLALTHALAISLGPSGIRVNAISPGWIHTTSEPLRPEDHRQHPVGRVGRPEDVAAACAFLASRAESGFMTGHNLVLDGGMTVKMIYV